jgi:cytochrome c oxidase subunit 4
MAHDTHAAHHPTHPVGNAAFNELDPHGTNAFREHHHHVTSWQLLLGILLALLFFTALTVFTAQGEQWVMDTFDVKIPHWVNIAGALSIATVKAVLVCAYFMQLRYDKALNTLVMLFCLLGVGLFLMFTMIDLGNRDTITPFKAGQAIEGGSGVALDGGSDEGTPARLAPRVTTNGLSLPQYRYETKLAKAESEQAFWIGYYKKNYLDKAKTPHPHPRDTANHFAAFEHKYHAELAAAGLSHHAADTNSANHSRPRTGLSGALDTADAHSDAHSESHSDSHDAPPSSQPAPH